MPQKVSSFLHLKEIVQPLQILYGESELVWRSLVGTYDMVFWDKMREFGCVATRHLLRVILPNYG